MNFKVTYLDEVPKINRKRSPGNIRVILDEFMKSDKPSIRIDPGKHYATLRSATSSWRCAVSRTGYRIHVLESVKENCFYLIKKSEEE